MSCASPSSVFVYGTLKPYLRYYDVALAGGDFQKQQTFVDGFDLFHLIPENYPVAIRGSGRISGWMYTYTNIDYALKILDELEMVDSEPPLYERVVCTTATGDPVWIYLGLDIERYTSGQDAIKVSDGNWLPS